MQNAHFTIKQVVKDPYNPHNSRVRLWPADSIIYGVNPDLAEGSEEFGNPPNIDAQVHFQFPGGTHCYLDTGVVFVMNSAGKTVDTFRLKDSEWF